VTPTPIIVLHLIIMLHLTVLHHAAPIITMLDLMVVALYAALLSHVPYNMSHVLATPCLPLMYVLAVVHACCPNIVLSHHTAVTTSYSCPIKHCYTISLLSHHCVVHACCWPYQP